jgi:hypothetical protein
MAQPFSEFGDDKRLLWLAEEWQRSADDLAEWALQRLVNRRDVWSQYTLSNNEVRVVMLPIPERRKSGTDMITLEKLRRHFAGRSVSHLIGLHAISDHSTCKWFSIDIDLHDEHMINADELADANFTAAVEWSDRLRKSGLDPILMDSNGVGGFHIWTLLDDEYPLDETYDYVDAIRSDYAEFGLEKKPEIFPPRREVEPDDLPYGLRLPGRHPVRQHYTRVWNFDLLGENEWLEGAEAIELLMSSRPGKLPETTPRAAPKTAKKRPKTKRKLRVCVDLDGVLASYDGWHGHDQIGPPIDGAREFAESIEQFAEIIIFTSRCSTDASDRDAVGRLSPGQSRIHVIDWLERNKIPFSDVYIGQGKPMADAFVDDRGVSCRPQEKDSAFDDALSAIRRLVKH